MAREFTGHMVELQNMDHPGVKYYETVYVDYNTESVDRFPFVEHDRLIPRYEPLLPVERQLVTLDEGRTPLIHVRNLGSKYNFPKLHVKDEGRNPTGSFKDRGSCVVVNAAIEQGVRRVNIVSSGNAAISTAAYAQRAGIDCYCYVSESTPQAKLHLIHLFGGKVVTIPGAYDDVYRHVADTKPPGWNVTTGQSIYRSEGEKTVAFELYEQLGDAPDVVIVPCGNGGLLAAMWKGFKELHRLSKISKFPKMFGVQITDAMRIQMAIDQGRDFAEVPEAPQTIADGMTARASFSSPLAIQAIKESGGRMIGVNDNEIIQGLKELIRLESIIPEPTSASVVAALAKIHDNPTIITPSDIISMIITGSGMKFLYEIARLTEV